MLVYGVALAAAWGWIVRLWRKLKAVDYKVEVIQRDGLPVVFDVRVGGRRKTDPPAPGVPAPIFTRPVDDRD